MIIILIQLMNNLLN